MNQYAATEHGDCGELGSGQAAVFGHLNDESGKDNPAYFGKVENEDGFVDEFSVRHSHCSS